MFRLPAKIIFLPEVFASPQDLKCIEVCHLGKFKILTQAIKKETEI